MFNNIPIMPGAEASPSPLSKESSTYILETTILERDWLDGPIFNQLYNGHPLVHWSYEAHFWVLIYISYALSEWKCTCMSLFLSDILDAYYIY